MIVQYTQHLASICGVPPPQIEVLTDYRVPYTLDQTIYWSEPYLQALVDLPAYLLIDIRHEFIHYLQYMRPVNLAERLAYEWEAIRFEHHDPDTPLGRDYLLQVRNKYVKD